MSADGFMTNRTEIPKTELLPAPSLKIFPKTSPAPSAPWVKRISAKRNKKQVKNRHSLVAVFCRRNIFSLTLFYPIPHITFVVPQWFQGYRLTEQKHRRAMQFLRPSFFLQSHWQGLLQLRSIPKNSFTSPRYRICKTVRT